MFMSPVGEHASSQPFGRTSFATVCASEIVVHKSTRAIIRCDILRWQIPTLLAISQIEGCAQSRFLWVSLLRNFLNYPILSYLSYPKYPPGLHLRCWILDVGSLNKKEETRGNKSLSSSRINSNQVFERIHVDSKS